MANPLVLPFTKAMLDRRSRRHYRVGVVSIVAVAIAVGVLFTCAVPFVTWVAWNVLGLGDSLGLGDLGVWGVVLLSVMLVGTFLSRMLILIAVLVVDPAWLQGAVTLHAPDVTLATVIAIASLLTLMSVRPAVASARALVTKRDRTRLF